MFKKLKQNIKKYEKSTALILITILMIYFTYQYYYKYFDILKDPSKIKELIISYGKYSIVAFLILQIIQVVVFFIPGEIIQISGGYIYGTFIGSILSVVGITIGSIIIYLISNNLGKPFVQKIIKKEKLKFFEKILKKYDAKYIIFILYLIPGIPKDILAYICGISEIGFNEFIIYSTFGRLPCIFISAYFGQKITSGDITSLIVIATVMTLLFFIGLLKGEKIIRKIVKKH